MNEFNFKAKVKTDIIFKFEGIPKLMFPYNEYYLTFALFEKLLDANLNPMLEPRMEVEKSIWSYTSKRKIKSYVYPDIVIPAYGIFLEVENFYTCNLNQFKSYLSLLGEKYGLRGCLVMWKCRSTYEHSNIFQVNPVTGFVEIKTLSGKRIEDVNEVVVGKVHRWIQYELFRWLTNCGYLCSAEIDVSSSGHVFVPDEIRLSHANGIVDWKPERFTKFCSKNYNPKTVDLCSYDGDLIKCYEVKLPDEFTTKSKALKALNQLLTYIKLGVFDEVWMVGDYVWLYNLWTNAPEVFFDELKSVGLLGYNFETRSFEVIKDAKQLDVKKRDYIKIDLID